MRNLIMAIIFGIFSPITPAAIYQVPRDCSTISQFGNGPLARSFRDG